MNRRIAPALAYVFVASAMVACALVCGACAAGDRYLVVREDLGEVLRLDVATREKSAVAARRASDGTQTFVRADSITPEPGAGSDVVPVTAAVPSRMIVAGSALTWIGSAMSVIGVALFFATDNYTPHWTGAALAITAEPIMIAGTVLWIVGALKRPQEVPPGRTGIHYVPPEAATPRAD